MSDSFYLFVYGTLKRGGCRERCWPHRAMSISPATIRAALYDLGPYPAIGPGEDLILGEAWEIAAEDWETTLAVLDNVEGFAGRADDEYVRRMVTCQLADGREVAAHTYFYRDETLLTVERRVMAKRGECVSWPATS